MRTGPPSKFGSVTPKSLAESRTCGSSEAGMPNKSSSSGSHWPVRISSSRCARIGRSVACTLPPVKRHSKYVSTVPKASWRRLPPRAHRHIVEQPGNFRGREIRIEQQTGALGDELLMPAAPERRAGVVRAAILPDDCVVDRLAGLAIQTIVVSRWLVMPIAATSLAVTPALASRRGRSRPTWSRFPAGRARHDRARKDLRKLELRESHGLERCVEQNARVDVVP